MVHLKAAIVLVAWDDIGEDDVGAEIFDKGKVRATELGESDGLADAGVGGLEQGGDGGMMSEALVRLGDQIADMLVRFLSSATRPGVEAWGSTSAAAAAAAIRDRGHGCCGAHRGRRVESNRSPIASSRGGGREVDGGIWVVLRLANYLLNLQARSTAMVVWKWSSDRVCVTNIPS